MHRNMSLLLCVLLAGGISIGVYTWYSRHQEKRLDYVESMLESFKKISHQKEEPEKVAPVSSPERIAKNWGELQAQLRDTVAQVFSEVAEFNWLEPYKSPSQYQSSGSGFFIDDEGHLITNAHVINQARAIYIQLPSFGKRRFNVTLLGINPDRDLALLRLKPKDVEEIKLVLGKIPFLKMGDSDQIHRADEVMALGYPLGMQQSIKSTNGMVSGREHISGQHFIQISAPINPGNSGGPLINLAGKCIGVNSAGVPSAQNVGFIIPSNDVLLFLKHLKQMPDTEDIKLVRKPFIGIQANVGSESMTEFLCNPQPGGLYVGRVTADSPLERAGVQAGDMLYEIDGYRLDCYGEMSVPWSEDKVSFLDYLSRLTIGDTVRLRVYRKGKEIKTALKFEGTSLAPVRRKCPVYEKIDYEVIGGMVLMELAIDHLPLLVQMSPDLTRYAELQNQLEGALVVTHILPASTAARARTLAPGNIITQINGEDVKNLDDARKALKKSLKTDFLTLKTHQNMFIVLPFNDILSEEEYLAKMFYYGVTPAMRELITIKRTNETQKAA